MTCACDGGAAVRATWAMIDIMLRIAGFALGWRHEAWYVEVGRKVIIVAAAKVCADTILLVVGAIVGQYAHVIGLWLRAS